MQQPDSESGAGQEAYNKPNPVSSGSQLIFLSYLYLLHHVCVYFSLSRIFLFLQ